jgi:hypothetical protein
MKDFAGTKNDHDEDELQRVPEFMRGSAYLDRRQQQILQSEQAIISLQRSIGNVAFDIARLLVAAPSAGNQAMLERSFGELNGLANAAAQAAASLPSGSDSGASRGADVDLNGTSTAIATHANSSSGNALKDVDDKSRKNAAKMKDLGDPAMVSGADQNAPGDAKPTGDDASASNRDLVNKIALEESSNQGDPPSDSPRLPSKSGSRSNMAALKLDHAVAVAKPDAADGQRAQGVEPVAQAASTSAEAGPTVVRKAPSPGGM